MYFWEFLWFEIWNINNFFKNSWNYFKKNFLIFFLPGFHCQYFSHPLPLPPFNWPFHRLPFHSPPFKSNEKFFLFGLLSQWLCKVDQLRVDEWSKKKSEIQNFRFQFPFSQKKEGEKKAISDRIDDKKSNLSQKEVLTFANPELFFSSQTKHPLLASMFSREWIFCVGLEIIFCVFEREIGKYCR